MKRTIVMRDIETRRSCPTTQTNRQTNVRTDEGSEKREARGKQPQEGTSRGKPDDSGARNSRKIYIRQVPAESVFGRKAAQHKTHKQSDKHQGKQKPQQKVSVNSLTASAVQKVSFDHSNIDTTSIHHPGKQKQYPQQEPRQDPHWNAHHTVRQDAHRDAHHIVRHDAHNGPHQDICQDAHKGPRQDMRQDAAHKGLRQDMLQDALKGPHQDMRQDALKGPHPAAHQKSRREQARRLPSWLRKQLAFSKKLMYNLERGNMQGLNRLIRQNHEQLMMARQMIDLKYEAERQKACSGDIQTDTQTDSDSLFQQKIDYFDKNFRIFDWSVDRLFDWLIIMDQLLNFRRIIWNSTYINQNCGQLGRKAMKIPMVVTMVRQKMTLLTKSHWAVLLGLASRISIMWHGAFSSSWNTGSTCRKYQKLAIIFSTAYWPDLYANSGW